MNFLHIIFIYHEYSQSSLQVKEFRQDYGFVDKL